MHKHLIVRAEVEKPFGFEDQELAADWLRSLVDKLGMKVIGGPYVAFSEAEGNKGISSCVLISTSHFCLNIWHENNPPLVQLDVYSCSHFTPEQVFDHLKVFKPTKIEYKFLDRESGLEVVDDNHMSYWDLWNVLRMLFKSK